MLYTKAEMPKPTQPADMDIQYGSVDNLEDLTPSEKARLRELGIEAD